MRGIGQWASGPESWGPNGNRPLSKKKRRIRHLMWDRKNFSKINYKPSWLLGFFNISSLVSFIKTLLTFRCHLFLHISSYLSPNEGRKIILNLKSIFLQSGLPPGWFNISSLVSYINTLLNSKWALFSHISSYVNLLSEKSVNGQPPRLALPESRP